MPFTALKQHISHPNLCHITVVRRLMPFTALKLSKVRGNPSSPIRVVRRLMPFTALKPQPELAETDEIQSSCAPPNAVYGIETSKRQENLLLLS